MVVLQIQDLDEKIKEVNKMIRDGKINAVEFYESLELTNNQWEKYKHIFVNKIDNDSYKIINDYYECASQIREQILFVKNLQHTHLLNMQGLLDSDCNSLLMPIIDIRKNNDNQLINTIDKMTTKNEIEGNIKHMVQNVILNDNNGFSVNDLKLQLDSYRTRQRTLIDIVNADTFIQYVTQQIYLTINNQLTQINSIEIIGCIGFKKIKKISKIK